MKEEKCFGVRGVHIGYILRIYVSMKVGSILERIFVF
jgi:hypothetical protein